MLGSPVRSALSPLNFGPVRRIRIRVDSLLGRRQVFLEDAYGRS